MENLIKSFEQHAEMPEKNRIDMIKTFKETYIDSPLPEHLADPFNIAKAFKIICEKIHELENR